MAELVQRNIEDILPEMNHLIKLGLFNVEESKAVMAKRKRFEYKMQRRTKEKEVYLQYIQYESNVLDLIKQRRQKMQIDQLQDKIEKPLVLRIYKLFRIACIRFKSDVKLWLTHINFAKQKMDRNRVSKIFTNLLQIHNKKPHLWIKAAKHEFEEIESIDTARQLFQRALRILPESEKLWIEYFKMELLCVELVMKRRELLGITETSETDKTVEDAILSCKIAQVVVRNGINAIGHANPSCIKSFVMIAKDFPFAKDLVDYIFTYVQSNEELLKREECLDIIAQRSLLDEKSILEKCKENGQTADFTIADLEQEANNAYLNAINTLNTPKMWNIYLDFCIERLNKNSQYLNDERFSRLINAFDLAKTSISLDEEKYVELVEVLAKFAKIEDALKLLDTEALKKFPASLNLWLNKLKIFIDMEKSEEEIMKLFNGAIGTVKEKGSYPLWNLILKWASLVNYTHLEELFSKGAFSKCREVAVKIRVKYLEWAIQIGGRSKVRSIYALLKTVPPYDLDFYQKYIEIEKSFAKVDNTLILAVYHEALGHFGKDNVNLWLNFIEFLYLNHQNDTQLCGDAHYRAKKELNEAYVEQFEQKFNLFKIKFDNKGLKTADIDEMDAE